MCNCGCNTCETKGPLLTEGKVKSLLSEGLQYHIDKKIPLFETVYRIGSEKHLSLIKEARKMYSRNVIDLCEEDEALIKTHLGEFALYEGESVPLDLPMLNEEVNNGDLDNAVYRLENVYKYLDIEYKETRRGEKYVQINYIPVTFPQHPNPEFVNVRYNNNEDLEVIKNRLGLPMLNESYYEVVANLGDKKTKENLDSFEEVQDFMDKMVKRNAISVDVTKFGKDKKQTIKYNWAGDKWKKESKSNINESYDYDEVAQSEFGMDYDQLGSGEKEWVRDEIDNMSMNESNSNYPDFDLNKNIRYQDTSISSGMWRYTGKEQGGKGVYRNLNNGQILGFDKSDFDIFRNNLSSHFDISESFSKKDWDVKWRLPKDNLFNVTKTIDANNNRYKALRSLLKSKPKELKAFDDTDNHPAYDMSYDELMKWFKTLEESINENEDKLLKIKQELEALRPGTISWIDDIFISSYDGSLQVELDYTLYPDEIKQLAQIAAKYGMELKYMTGKNATLVKTLQEKLKGIDGKECWKGYKLSGTKKKGGKTVDNCVPMEENLKEDRKYNQEELLRLDLIARRRFDCDYENCTDEQKAEVLKDKVKVGVKEALQEAKKEIDEAEFKGKKVALGKPKRGGPKAYYVYVKDGDKVKKVTFGSGGLRAKIKNKEARNAFAARHNCKDKKDRTKAGYWSCNLPRYAPALGLGAKMNTFW